jgi:hypothetical protein
MKMKILEIYYYVAKGHTGTIKRDEEREIVQDLETLQNLKTMTQWMVLLLEVF